MKEIFLLIYYFVAKRKKFRICKFLEPHMQVLDDVIKSFCFANAKHYLGLFKFIFTRLIKLSKLSLLSIIRTSSLFASEIKYF